ncbi:flagellar basal-body rod protein FlgB [Aliiroseovarius halocynthiae]|uniref:FlgB family protein n=1 Tax=Aliiroseovarius halocynthiae TaxID=985055 RepID=A0A545SLR6_9RHOB|nr:FlgB family protein [Aliiroseovarius halocynthiae]TQV65901.1 FlgB family protein [Aliiroseovarius halocynthiae]SMR83468.1 flagellar basal-body rod protein FlgB [Aliiroseovarius halocynthiae]
MFEKLTIFAKANHLALHAAARQSVIAQNVANADTPGYRARDVASFSETYRPDQADQMRATRTGHFGAPGDATAKPEIDTVYRPGATSPNGNSVSLETEMMMAAEAKRDHDMALAVYKSTLGIMRSSLGRR